jgi:hypothetical protein
MGLPVRGDGYGPDSLIRKQEDNTQEVARFRAHDPFSRRHDDSVQELARLRRIEDIRSLVPANRSPRLRSGASTPNLHDFATKTHLARIDLQIEGLDNHVQQCVQQMAKALSEQQKNVKDIVEDAFSGEKSGESSLDAGFHSRIKSLEERVAASPAGESHMAARVALLETKVAVSPDLGTRVASLEERLQAPPSSPKEAEINARMAAVEKKLTTWALTSPFEAEMKGHVDNINDKLAGIAAKESEMRARVKFLEENRIASHPGPETLLQFTKMLANHEGPSSPNMSPQRARLGVSDRSALAAPPCSPMDMIAQARLAAVDSLAQAQAELRTRLDKMAERFQVASLTEAGLETRVDAIDEKLAAGTGSALAERVAALQATVDKVVAEQQCASPSCRDARVKTAVAELSGQFELELAKINPALKENAAIREELRAIQKQVCAVGGVSAVSVQDDSPSKDVDNLTSAVKDLAAELASVKEQVSAISDVSAATTLKVGTLNGDLARQSTVAEGEKTLDDPGHRSLSKDAIAEPEELGRADVESWKKATEDKILELDSRMQGVVEALKEKIGSVKEDLENAVTSPSRAEHEDLLRRLESAEEKLQFSKLVEDLKEEETISNLRVAPLSEECIAGSSDMPVDITPPPLPPPSVAPGLDEKQVSRLDEALPSPRLPEPCLPPGATTRRACRAVTVLPAAGDAELANLSSAANTRVPEDSSPAKLSPTKVGNARDDRSSAPSDSSQLQASEKRAAAAAIILMEKRLQGFVPTDEFTRHQAHVEAGFERLSAKIQDASESQHRGYEATLDKFLQKRRVKGWLKTHPKQYTRMLGKKETRLLDVVFRSWSEVVSPGRNAPLSPDGPEVTITRTDGSSIGVSPTLSYD